MQRWFLVLLLALFVMPAYAGETVKSPVVEQGLLELEHKGRYQMDTAGSRNHKKELEYNIQYGVTDRWRVRAEAVLDDGAGGDMTYRRTRIENTFQLLKSKLGAPLDLALDNDFTVSDRSDSSHDVTFGFFARKDLGITTNTANVLVRRDWGDTAARGVNIIARWQTKYNLIPEFQPAIQIMGDTKKRDALRDQSLCAGPGFVGAIGLDRLGGDANQKLSYEAFYTIGATPATPDHVLQWRLKYGIQF